LIFYTGKNTLLLIFSLYQCFTVFFTVRDLVEKSFMAEISDRIKRIKETIASACARSGRESGDVKLVVVTKSAAIEAVEKVIRLGYTELGENRVQQLKKVSSQIIEILQGESGNSSLLKKVKWHMIGHLQRNKVRQVLPIATLIHSVDTLRLAEEINNAALKMNLRPRVLMQVNTSNEPQKYGVPVGAATHLAEQIETLSHIQLAGLMTMAPLTRDKDVVRACFVRAAELFAEMRGEKIVGPQFTELSMGMSSDYEVAVEEGATILRIGSAIFAG
jgi:pyridoxal phosphate enzyme (YggS family)